MDSEVMTTKFYGRPAFSVLQFDNEPARSWLIRMACLADVAPDAMHDHLLNLGEIQSQFRSDLIRVPLNASWAGGGSRPPMTTYCPLCFAHDLRRRELPYFRHQHQDAFTTYCRTHLTPLFLWPHCQSVSKAYFPKWVLDLQSEGRPLTPVGDKNKEVILQMRQARRILKSSAREFGEPLAWRQQIGLEKMISTPELSASLIGGGRGRQLKSLVWDYAILMASQFGQQRCEASHLSSFLGPSWIFSTRFSDGQSPALSERCSLASFANPAQRRSLLSLSLRMLISFGVDPSFNANLDPTDAGQTVLSRELDKLPAAAVQWARTRSNHWSELTRLGFGAAIRRNADAWTDCHA